ncbi:hypothetical protein A2W24_04655 [Microgenomates group bacterium RBG_16_45_19]|nr:MAG: hypothetical protein A2W24_04655 [Microgenomates group bacterium RBG_16_45_19]
MEFLVAGVLFVLGAILGSFINVLISRSVEGEDWVRGRSRCDHCRQQIKWYDNLPLLSYMVLGGKCRSCQGKIAIQHPIIELLTGLMLVWWYAIGFTFFRLVETPLLYIQPVFWLAVGILLLIIFVTDWLYQIIPDFANITLGVLAVVYRLYLSLSGVMRWQDFWLALLTGVVMGGLLYLIWVLTRGRGMGLGDVKFALVMGVLLGWPRAAIALFLAFLLGAVVGIILLLLKWKKPRERIAFGPFLILGTALALVWGFEMWSWYWGWLG